MGVLFHPQYEKWYKDKAMEEKIQKRLDFDEHVVSCVLVLKSADI